LRELSMTALVAVRRWADPRERELRRRRRARANTMRLGAASGVTAAGAIGLAVVSAPVWAVVVVGGGTAVLVANSALAARRYLRLRRRPLPAAAFIKRPLPPLGSAARTPLARLVKAERALYELSAAISRTRRLAPEDLEDTVSAANSSAAALHALASDIVAMEEAASAAGKFGQDLVRTVTVSVRQLHEGVVEYERVVTAAAHVLAVTDAGSAITAPAANAELRAAADRLDGWAEALAELATPSPAPAPGQRRA
jgi:hypothetical protein